MSGPAGGGPHPPSVMVCSDDAVLRAMIARNLVRRGFRVCAAPLAPLDPGAIPLGAVFDVVVADLDVLPARPGGADWFRATFPYVPFVLLGHDAPSSDQLQRLRPCRYLRKPFSIRELLDACDGARDGRRRASHSRSHPRR